MRGESPELATEFLTQICTRMAEVEIEEVQLFCMVCGTLVPEDDAPEFNGNPRVDGDWFFRATCSKCNKGKAKIERLSMTWQEVTHFAIYQLTLASEKSIFFRWREDICNLIDSHWDYLIPSKKRTPTWQSTVASTLSTSNDLFLNGFEQNNKQQGWWALVELAPPKPKTTKDTAPKKRSVKGDAGSDATPASKETESAKRQNGEGSEGQSVKKKKHAGSVDSSTPGATKRKHEKDSGEDISAKKMKPIAPIPQQQRHQTYPPAPPHTAIYPPPMAPPVYPNQMPPNSMQPTNYMRHAVVPVPTSHIPPDIIAANQIATQPFSTNHMQTQCAPQAMPANQMQPRHPFASGYPTQPHPMPANQMPPQGMPANHTQHMRPPIPVSASTNHIARQAIPPNHISPAAPVHRTAATQPTPIMSKELKQKPADFAQKPKVDDGKAKERAEGKEKHKSVEGKQKQKTEDGKEKKRKDEGRSKEREKEGEAGGKYMTHEGKVKEKKAKKANKDEGKGKDLEQATVEERKKKPKTEEGKTKKSEEGKEKKPKGDKEVKEKKESKKLKEGKAMKERKGTGEQSGGDEGSKKTKKQKAKSPKTDTVVPAGGSDSDQSEYEEEGEENEGTGAGGEKTETGAEKRRTRRKALKLMGEREEGQLLQQLLALSHQLHGPVSARLRQKLLIRQCKRKRGLPLFDLDKTVRQMVDVVRAYENKEPVPYGRKEDQSPKKRKTPRAGAETENSGPGLVVGRGVHILDRYQARYRQGMTEEAQKSFRALLAGMSQAEEETGLRPIKSPFTERMLKPFIRRDFETIPARLQLLEDIVQYPNRNNPRWAPPPQCPIDYCYVKPFHIAACNALCQDVFWPGIDVSECLTYPDFTVVALYKKLVIGCAFMTPEAYITYIVVHPQWRGHGISSFMLYHLLQTCAGKDVTLHVSATNPAMILYQSFGFKVEEYIIGFYDKYYPEDSKECKNAFFMRLRR